MKRVFHFPCLALLLLLASPLPAQDADIPWGRAVAQEADYAPQKVVYDVAVKSRAALENVLDRVSFLNNLYGANPFDASIVVVLHGGEIPMFALENLARDRDLMERAQSLTVAGPVEFRMCVVAARAHGYAPGDMHGFVRMVPMADAELVKLQREQGYAYMR